MPIGPARMPLMEHLGELRMRLMRCVVVIIIAICVLYLATPVMGQMLLMPVADFLPKDANGMASLQAIDPFEAFSVRFKISFWAALVCTCPITIWQILAFFLPALKPKERRWFVPTFIAATALFIFGIVFCYAVILHPAFQWLTDQAMGLGTVEPRMDSYIDIIIKFELGFGFAFELPVIVFYLVVFKIVPYKKMRGAWRYIYVGLVVLAAMVTPDGNPVTMGILAAVLIALYEISMLLSRVVLAKRIKEQEAEELELYGELDDDDEDEDED